MGTLNTFTSGINTTFSTELNENFALVGQVLASDSTTTTWDQGDTSYITLASLSVGTVTNGAVIIMVDIDTESVDNSSGSTRPAVELKIGEAGSETTKRTYLTGPTQATGSGSGNKYEDSKTLTYYHELTAGEKSNGLSVLVNGKYTNSASATTTSTYYQTVVFGVPDYN